MRSSSIAVVILAALVLQCPFPVHAASDAVVLPETITGELVLSESAILEKNVTVARGGSLILKPGADLRAASGTALIINGKLHINGLDDDPVKITSAEGTAWKGISLMSGSEGVISNARISGADKGISILAARIDVAGTTITGCQTAVHLVREAAAQIAGVLIKDNRVGLAAEMRSTGRITDCTFEGNKVGLGIASGATPMVKANRFIGNDLGVQVLQRYPGVIQSNVFEGNKVGIRLYQNGPDTIVEKNRFAGNSEAAVLALSYTSPVIRNNYLTGGKYGIFANQFSSPVIENNVIRKMEQGIHLNKKNVSTLKKNIISDSNIGIFFDFSSYPLVRENLFADNEMHLKLGRFQSSDWESRAGSKNLVLESAARQGSRNPKLGEGPVEFPEAVDAAGNWWDGKTLREMAEKGGDGNITSIYDSHDLPEVTYEGFGEETYKIDRILYQPVLEVQPVSAGLVGWEGTADELAHGR